jgi:hypothetical protein
MSNGSLIRLARAGDQQELVRRLEAITARTHDVSKPGIEMSESQKLFDEALWYARQGDLDEAIYRLSL